MRELNQKAELYDKLFITKINKFFIMRVIYSGN